MLRKIEKSLRREKIVWKANVISTAKVPIIKMNAGRYARGPHRRREQRPLRGAVDQGPGERFRRDATAHPGPQEAPEDAPPRRRRVHRRVRRVPARVVGGVAPAPRAASGRSANPNLGALLLGFLRRFGNEFDYSRMAVAAGRPSGVIRAKDLVVGPGAFGMRPMILAEDPQVSVARAVSFSTLFFLLLRGFVRWTTVRRAR